MAKLTEAIHSGPEAELAEFIVTHADSLATFDGWMTLARPIKEIYKKFFVKAANPTPVQPRSNRPLNPRQQTALRASRAYLGKLVIEASTDEMTIANKIRKNADKLAAHLMSLAQVVLKSGDGDAQLNSSLKKIWNTNMAKPVNSSLDKLRSHLQRLIEAGDDKKKEDKKGTAGPSKDRDTGEILYHLDMATRHLDVLIDYTLVIGHEDEIVSISSGVQELAQRLRSEFEAERTPYDEQEMAGKPLEPGTLGNS